MIYVRLTKDEIRFADSVGRAFHDQAKKRNRQPRNGAPIDDHEALAIHILGARCEYAGKLYCDPVVWHTEILDDVRNTADLEDWIDIKGIEKSHYRLMVQKDDQENWAYFLVDGTLHPLYKMIGWCWGHEAKQKQYWDDPKGGRPAYFVPRTAPIMKPPWELLFEIKRRQA